MKGLKNNCLLWVLFAVLSFPMFYFVYKFGNPLFGANDFFSYYKLYESWDFKNVEAPFNMRLLSSGFVYLLHKAGLHYNTETVFDQFNLDRSVFFSSVLFNFICVISTCLVIFRIINKRFRNIYLSFIAAFVYLMGFGTLFYELMPITDAFSVLLLAIIFELYLARKYLVLIPFTLVVIQREYILLAFMLVTFMDYIKYRDKYYMIILVSNVVLFAVYMVLRKTIFYTPHFDHQASTGYFLDSVTKVKFPIVPYIKQTLMTINIYLVYIGVVCYKAIKQYKVDYFAFCKLVFLFLQINLISFAAVFGNNTGRYFYILIPMVIYHLMDESVIFFNKFSQGPLAEENQSQKSVIN